MSLRQTFAGLTLATAAALSAAPANAGLPANLLPDATGQVSVSAYGYDANDAPFVFDQRTIAFNGVGLNLASGGDGVTGMATLSAGVLPTVTATVNSVNGRLALSTTAEFTYYFAAAGPTGVEVPVDMQALLKFQGSEDGTAGGFLAILHGADLIYYSHSNGTVPLTFNIDTVLTLQSNDIYRVWMVAQAFGGESHHYDDPHDASGSALVDPMFSIDPIFLGQNPDFTLRYSANLFGPSDAGVPEPGTWTLLILGFGSVGAMTRRRRVFAAA